jgi:6-phosphogluconolactonase
MKLILHSRAEALAEAIATQLGSALDAALAADGHATLALAGGRTAPPIFAQLAAQPRDWSPVTLLPSDERWVAADHADRNSAALRTAFASVDGVRFLDLVPPNPVGRADAGTACLALAEQPQRFAATLLGMGADGHFASLFPGAPNLATGLDPATAAPAIAIVPDPMPAAGPHPRISLTLSRILKSRTVVLAITGADKRAVLEAAAAGDESLPVAALLRAAPDLFVHWSP